MDKAQKALELLIAGISQEAVALTIGCDPSYISQLMAIPEYKQQVLAARVERGTKHQKMDEKKDQIVDTLLDKMLTIAPTMYKPTEILQALTRIDAMPRRSSPVLSTGQEKGNTTIINIPIMLQKAYNITVDTNNRVVEIGTDTMVPASASSLERLAQERQARNDQLKLQGPGKVSISIEDL